MYKQRVVIAVDLSGASDTVVAQAARLATDLQWNLELVYVQPRYNAIAHVADDDRAQVSALERLHAYAAHLREAAGPIVSVDVTCAYGDVAATITRAVTDAQLLLIGQTHAPGLWGKLGGATARALIEGAACPVLVVPAGATHLTPRSITVAIDDGALPARGFALLRAVAQQYGSALDVIHQDDGDERRPGDELARVLTDVPYTYHFERGRKPITDFVLDRVVDYDADWVAVVHHGGRRGAFGIGDTVSTRVAAVAPRPILVLPAPLPRAL